MKQYLYFTHDQRGYISHIINVDNDSSEEKILADLTLHYGDTIEKGYFLN